MEPRFDADGRFEALSRVLLEEERPSGVFRAMGERGELARLLPELAACVDVAQNPVYHPEGDVFEHTMLVIDRAAELRGRAKHPRAFMWAALVHDLGKAVTTQVQPDGKITSYGHERAGMPLAEAMLGRLTRDGALLRYAVNMTWLHMRPNVLAECRSRRKKTRQLFDMSACPEDLILLARADATGRKGIPYDEATEAFLWERLEDYRRMLTRPMATEADLLAAGVPVEALPGAVKRARLLHLSGLEKHRAAEQVAREMNP